MYSTRTTVTDPRFFKTSLIQYLRMRSTSTDLFIFVWNGIPLNARLTGSMDHVPMSILKMKGVLPMREQREISKYLWRNKGYLSNEMIGYESMTPCLSKRINHQLWLELEIPVKLKQAIAITVSHGPLQTCHLYSNESTYFPNIFCLNHNMGYWWNWLYHLMQ